MASDRGLHTTPLTDEQVRILRAIAEGRMVTNASGRYVIEGEPRPDRKSRERLRSRGLIDHYYTVERGFHWLITDKGKAILDDIGASVHVVGFINWDEFQIRSVWTTAQGAWAECKKLTATYSGSGYFDVYEYPLNTAEVEAS